MLKRIASRMTNILANAGSLACPSFGIISADPHVRMICRALIPAYTKSLSRPQKSRPSLIQVHRKATAPRTLLLKFGLGITYMQQAFLGSRVLDGRADEANSQREALCVRGVDDRTVHSFQIYRGLF